MPAGHGDRAAQVSFLLVVLFLLLLLHSQTALLLISSCRRHDPTLFEGIVNIAQSVVDQLELLSLTSSAGFTAQTEACLQPLIAYLEGEFNGGGNTPPALTARLRGILFQFALARGSVRSLLNIAVALARPAGESAGDATASIDIPLGPGLPGWLQWQPAVAWWTQFGAGDPSLASGEHATGHSTVFPCSPAAVAAPFLKEEQNQEAATGSAWAVSPTVLSGIIFSQLDRLAATVNYSDPVRLCSKVCCSAVGACVCFVLPHTVA